MKIAVITYHAAYNYGSALQAYALCHALKRLGHEPQVIDYRTERQEKLYRLYTDERGLYPLLRNFQSWCYYKKLTEHKRRFDVFVQKNIPLTVNKYHEACDLKNETWDFDCYICGSDQIWNPNCVDFDTSYLLDFVHDKERCIAYAPSIAADRLPDKWHAVFRENLRNYSSLSVREALGAGIISQIMGRHTDAVLDPVFLLTEDDWKRFTTRKSDDYILCYFIGDISGMRKYAIQLGRKYHKRLVVINKNLRDWMHPCKKRYESGPEDFVDLVYNAYAVCTNSFHAVALSLIFGKEFHAFVDNEHSNTARSRIVGLLQSIGMEDRIVKNTKKLLPGERSEVRKYQNALDMKIRDSRKYLFDALENVEKA